MADCAGGAVELVVAYEEELPSLFGDCCLRGESISGTASFGGRGLISLSDPFF